MSLGQNLRKSELSQKQSLEKTLRNIKYSNIPVNVPTILPAEVRERAATLRHLSLPDIKEKYSKPRPKLTHYYIGRHDDQDDIEMILQLHAKKDSMLQRPIEKKGSMSIGELWGDKYRNGVIKTTGLYKVFKSIQKAEAEDLNERLTKIEKIYKSRCLYESSTTDTSKILEDFKVKGLNSIILDSSSFCKNSDSEFSNESKKIFKSCHSLTLTESCFLQDACSPKNKVISTTCFSQTPKNEKKKNIRVQEGDKIPAEKSCSSFSLQTLSSSRKTVGFSHKNNSRTKELLKSIVNPNHSEKDFSKTTKSKKKYLDI